MNTTTYGIGEAILRALDEGIRKFVIGLGGSSTNDGGLGMLLALGATIKNEHGERSGIYGKDLLSVSSANLSTIDSRLSLCDIRIASDVDNPLCGKYGASTVFGPQKGATTEQINRLDEALERYSKILMKENSLSDSIAVSPGAGAAGGLGFAFMVIGAMIESGAELIGRTISLHKEIAGADLVITGEGKSDEQTLYGKAPGFVADLASKLAVPVILISGSISDNQKLDNHFDEIYSIMNRNLTLRQAMQDAKMLLLNKTSRIFQRWVNSQINKEEFFMVKAVHTEKAPAAIGPYSQAIQAGDFVFVSGQIGIDPKNGEVVDGIENQTKQVLENLKAILTEVGADFTQVVKFTIYLSSMDNFATVNDIYGSFLQEPYPARATVEVSRLPKDVLVEMDVVVYTK